jgi:exopolysaccharide biosynthesis polyprenyl glycosylphosphotransferase
MIARQQEIRLQLNQLIDALLLGGVFWLCYTLRHANLLVLPTDTLAEIPSFEQFLWILAVIMPFGPFLLELQGYYAHPLEKTVWKSLQQIARAGIWLGLIVGGAVIFLRLSVPSRSVLILFCLTAPGALIFKERVYAWHRLMRLKQGETGERIIMAGEQERMREIVRTLTVAQRLEVRIVERVDLEVCDVSELVSAIHRHSVGRVILAFSRLEMDKVQHAIEACEVEGVEAWLSADFIRTSVARPTYESLGGRPMLVFRATPDLSWALLVKGMVDWIGAFIGLILLSPVFIALAIAVRLSSPGPIIFSQRRAGIHGKPFTMWKFRTMAVDAEQRHAELRAQNEMSGPVFKVQNDPRITKIGKLLRKTSLDELPQLVNVLFGDMSLVGPRPLPLYEVESFQAASHRRRLSMKPGLTCLWQVRGRNNVKNFDDWVKMDLEYIDNWSLVLDLKILVQTIPVVLLGSGAK